MRLAASCAIPFVIATLGVGCGLAPGTSLAEARHGNRTTRLEEGPVLVRRGETYLLRYRFAAPAHGRFDFAQTVLARRDADAGYYYFLGVVQSTVLERGRLVERAVADDGLEELARAGRVFWLDPDGTTHPIPVLDETPETPARAR